MIFFGESRGIGLELSYGMEEEKPRNNYAWENKEIKDNSKRFPTNL